jgi:N-acetylneuraminate synthase
MTGDGVLVRVAGASPLRLGECKVIAEAGANHNNSVERAVAMAAAAADAGAWAIKFQLYKASQLTVPDSPKYWEDPFGTNTQFEAFQLSDRLDYGAWAEVAAACHEFGIVFFATPFDLDAVASLEEIGAPLYKLASADITHRILIEEVAKTGKPVLMSTGAATEDEIDRAIEWSGLGPDRLVPLVCTLTYPTPDEDANFGRLETFRDRFAPYLTGTSDHTLGPDGAMMTAALGGVCIEKHYTTDPHAPDVPDHAMSVTPDELTEMVRTANRGAVLRGVSDIGVRESEEPARMYARRSIVSAVAIDAGSRITREMIDFRRPGTGIPAHELEVVVGSTARVDIPADTTLFPSHLS